MGYGKGVLIGDWVGLDGMGSTNLVQNDPFLKWVPD